MDGVLDLDAFEQVIIVRWMNPSVLKTFPELGFYSTTVQGVGWKYLDTGIKWSNYKEWPLVKDPDFRTFSRIISNFSAGNHTWFLDAVEKQKTHCAERASTYG